MAKIYGLFGSMTGKLADTVMSVRNGEQLARKYQPIVSNPSTPAQVEQRAKLKLLSQLSAVMAPVIAIPKQGAVSARNLFTKKNFGLTTFTQGIADITLANVQLTSSVVALPRVNIGRVENSFEAYLETSEDGSAATLSRIVYCLFVKQTDGKMRLLGSDVVEKSSDPLFRSTQLPYTNSEVVLLAYGVRDNTEAARVVFGDMVAPTAETVAKVITSRTLVESDITVTETRGSALVAASRDGGPEVKTSKKN